MTSDWWVGVARGAGVGEVRGWAAGRGSPNRSQKPVETGWQSEQAGTSFSYWPARRKTSQECLGDLVSLVFEWVLEPWFDSYSPNERLQNTNSLPSALRKHRLLVAAPLVSPLKARSLGALCSELWLRSWPKRWTWTSVGSQTYSRSLGPEKSPRSSSEINETASRSPPPAVINYKYKKQTNWPAPICHRGYIARSSLPIP